MTPATSGVLLTLAHPALERSRANRALAKAAKGLEGVTFHDLYETYPDFAIDIEAEQEKLLAHDVIAVQFPLYWYSTPALMKEWFDLVWLHGFAYGLDGNALAGKRCSPPAPPAARPRPITPTATTASRWTNSCARWSRPPICAAWSGRRRSWCTARRSRTTRR
jgi:hypothetical protein